MAKTNKKAVNVFETVWYSICGALSLWGLVYIVLGLIANYADIPASKNPILSGSNAIKAAFGMDFLGWGVLLFALGVLLAIIVLLTVAGTVDKTTEKAARRAARLAKIEAEMNNEAK